MPNRLSALIVIGGKFTVVISALEKPDLNPVEKQKNAINIPLGENINTRPVKNAIESAFVKK
jgi:hypothetical protein